MKRSIFNVAEAKARLPELIERAADGEEIVLARAGKPRARLMPLEPAEPKQLRVPGKGKGRFRSVSEPEAPLSEEWIALFEGRASS
ncbi:type II toxin-antitoxin system Phd/YefM family antitoxin [Pendulispora albinea]|uniref:Antitoxin n=1 Tax=Pendulispora albinea TaxID=2741071 RepID=A0ABZ2LZA4_9BACT